MEVRDKILVEATRLIATNGFEATSLQAVAEAVGVKKQSLLYYFPSKDELRKAVLEQLLARWNDVLPRLLKASALTGLAKFDAVTGELFEFFVTDPDRAKLIVRELLDRPQAMNEVADRFIHPWVELVSGYIRLGQEAGQIQTEVDPEAYVLMVANMALATLAALDAVEAVLPDKKKATKRVVKELVRMARTSLFSASYLAHQDKKGRAPARRGVE